MNKINVDTNNSIKFAQPFDVVGVPQTNISQNTLDAATINRTPKPVNIKIKVKNKEEIARGFGVTLPKFSTNGPKKLRLVSSDQTIISFDLFMETGNEKKIPKKTHNKFFELFKPRGCFNNQSDDDVYPYVPSSSNETYTAKSASQVNDLQDDKICEEKFALKKNLETMMSTNMTLKSPTFLGKCKPGGCLDPPFNEDKYIYKPKHNTSAIDQIHTEKLDLDETCNKDTKHTAKDIEKADISSRDSPSKSSFEKNCSRSLITYPPALSSSDIRDQEEIPSKKSKLRTSTENNVRLSINEFSDIYYMPPKKQKSKSNEKLSSEVSENLNVRCDSFDTYSWTGYNKGQKKERISSSKNELQATDLNLVNPHINERCQKKTENIFFNDNYNATVGEMVKIETLKVSAISDESDTNLDIFEDTFEKKINILASSRANIEGTENRETETKIDINVLETNLDSSSVTKSSLIFKNKMTPENLPTIAKDLRISKIESNSDEKLDMLKPVPDKSVDNHLVASQDRNKLPIENQSLRSYRLFNSDETKMKFEPLILPDEVTLKSSQTAVMERSTDSTKLDQIKGRLTQYEESDHLSVQKQKKKGTHKESTYSSIKEQIHDNQYKECDHSLIKEEILDREYRDSEHSSVKEQNIHGRENKKTDHSSIIQDREHEESDHSSTKKQIQVKEDKESDFSTVKEQIQERTYDNFEPSSLKEQTQGRKHKESDLSSVKEQIEDKKYKESYRSSVKEELQDKKHKIFDLSSLKEQIQNKEYKESDQSSVKNQLQDREYKLSDLPSLKDQIQGRDYKESDYSSSKEQIRDKEYKESDYLFVKEQTQDKEHEKSDQSSIKAQIQDKKPFLSSHLSVKEQIQARKDKGTDHSSVKEELRDREYKIYNPSSLKEQIRDIENKDYDHSSVKEQLRDRKHKTSDRPSLKELIQDTEYKESDHSSSKVQIRDKQLKESHYSSVKEQIQDRKYEESDNSSSKVQIRDKELKESDYSSVKEQTQDREREESDHSSIKEQVQDKKHMASNHSSVKEQIQVREDNESDHSSVKGQRQYRENNNIDYSSIKEHIKDKENKKSDHASVIELIRDRLPDRDHKVYDHSSLKEQIQDGEYKESDYSSAKEQIHDREITDVNQKEFQQNRLLQDVDSHDIFDKQGLHEIIDKNTVQDFATLVLGEAADQKSNNRMSREPSPLFQEKISSTLQTQKEDNNDLIYFTNKTSLANSQIMKLTPTLKATSTSITLPTQKKDTIGNEPVGYENKNSLVTSQIIKPTSSLNQTTPPAFPDKSSTILQTQENTNDKHPEYYENKINLATSHILKLPINLSERTTKSTDNLKIQSSNDDVQGLSSIVPIEVQSIKNNDFDHRYGLFNKDFIIEKEESGDKRSIEIKPQFQTNISKVNSIPADYEMARYYSSDVSASFNKEIENRPQMISNEYLDIYQKSSNLNFPESYSASSKKAVVKNDKINVIELEEENVHEKTSFIKINLGFHTYLNDKNEIVIKSFDTSEHLKKDPRAKITIIQSIIRKSDNGIRIPVNSEMDLILQLKKSLDIDNTKKESTKKDSRKSSDEDILLQETVVSVYENLVPVKNIIRNLKEEAGFLTQQQILLREILNTMKTTSMKIINTNNKMCSCNRYSI